MSLGETYLNDGFRKISFIIDVCLLICYTLEICSAVSTTQGSLLWSVLLIQVGFDCSVLR